jgi:hypothetical protein
MYRKLTRGFLVGLKYAGMIGIGLSVFGFVSTQYIKSEIGPIRYRKDEAVEFYIKNYNSSRFKALFTYYTVYFDITLIRIFSYLSYATCCQRLIQYIVSKSLLNYEKINVL